MGALVFIGDELTAAGYRLAGAQVRIADPTTVRAALDELPDDVALVLLGATVAAALSPKELARRLALGSPLLAIVEDLGGVGETPNLGREVRVALGVES